jgi:membrane protein GlpM
MELLVKATIGAVVVLIIHFLSKTPNYYLAALVVLFPTFSLISHIIIGSSRSVQDLKTTAIFGIFATIPLIAYGISVVLLSDKLKLYQTLLVSVLVWFVLAILLVLVWKKFV